MIPSPSDLTYFIEVASTLNLSRASERLGISQPSLSLSIQRIEKSLGTLVLTRCKRGVMLTQAGKQLLAHSRSLLETWEKVKSTALASENEIQGAYTIGCHPSVALYSLSGFLPNLMEKHPKLEIKLKHDLSRKITEGVINTGIDIGIAVNPVQHLDLVIHKLCDDEVTLWVPQDFRFPKTIGSTANPLVLICDPDLIQSQSIIKGLNKQGIMIGRVIESSSLEVVASLTANGCGVGLLPSRVVTASVGKQVKRMPNAPIYRDKICLLFRIENKHVRAIQAIGKAVRGFFDEKKINPVLSAGNF